MAFLSDKELVEELQSGSRRAFAEMYERLKEPVFAYCLRMLGDRPSAEDAAHDAFFKAFEAIHTLDEPRAFRAWLYRIVRNEVFSQLRRKRTVPLNDDVDVWDEDNPHLQLVARERAETLQLLLGRLKPEFREALVLREYDGLSYEEICCVTGDSLAAIKSRIFKARKALATKLKSYYS